MVWGGFGMSGKTDLAIITTRMDSKGYTEMLKDSMLTVASKICGRNFIFQQDNAAIHASKYTMDWFRKNKVEVMKWPARSPDLNPIENLWGMIARDVYGKGRQYQSIRQLKCAIIRAWNNISVEKIGRASCRERV